MKLARAVAIFAAVMWLIAGCVIAHARLREVNDKHRDEFCRHLTNFPPCFTETKGWLKRSERDRVPKKIGMTGWVKSADVGCNDVGDCFVIDNYTDDRGRGMRCVLFGIPVYNHPHGKIVGSLVNDAGLVKKIWQREGFTYIESDDINDDVGDFSGCG